MGRFQVATRISSILVSLLLLFASQLFAATASPGKIKTSSTKNKQRVFSSVTVLDDSEAKHESVRQTSDGGFVTITSTSNAGGAVITKTDGAGRKIWDRSFGFKWPELTADGFEVQQTPDGGYLATGKLEENRSDRLWVLRLDPEGKTVWEKRIDKTVIGGEYSDTKGNALVQNSDGTFMVAAADFQQGFVFLFKFSASGEIIWKKQFSNMGIPEKSLHTLTDLSRRRAVWLVAQDSGYLMAYHTKDPSTPKKSPFFRVMRLDGNGESIWSTDITDQLGYAKNSHPQLHTLITTSDGGFAILLNLSTFGAGCVVKFNRDGKLEWRSRPEVVNEEFTGQMFGGGLVELPEGGYATAVSFMPGERMLGYQDSTILFLKMDRSGNIILYRVFGNKNSWHLAGSLQRTGDGGFIVGGFHAPNKQQTIIVGKAGAWLLKLNSDGNNPAVPQVKGIKLGAKIYTFKGDNERESIKSATAATVKRDGPPPAPLPEKMDEKKSAGSGGYNFERAFQFFEGFARVEKKTSSGGFVIGFMDTRGDIWSLPENWFALYQFSDGLVGFSPERNGKWGFMDKTGKTVIPAQFEFIENFRNGLAAVKKDGKWGFIDKSGRFAIPPTFGDQGPGFSDGLAKMQQNGKNGFIDKAGRNVIPFTLQSVESFSEGLARFTIIKKDSRGEDSYFIGYIGKNGKVVIPAEYEEAQDFSEGMAAVRRKDEKWRYINKSGKTVIPPRFDTADSFSEGFAYTSITTEPGYINTAGKKVISLPEKKTDFGYRFSDGIAMVSLKGKSPNEYGSIGFIDRNGQWKIPPRGDLNIFTGWAAVGKFGYSFSDGYFVVTDRNESSPSKGKFGFIITSAIK